MSFAQSLSTQSLSTQFDGLSPTLSPTLSPALSSNDNDNIELLHIPSPSSPLHQHHSPPNQLASPHTPPNHPSASNNSGGYPGQFENDDPENWGRGGDDDQIYCNEPFNEDDDEGERVNPYASPPEPTSRNPYARTPHPSNPDNVSPYRKPPPPAVDEGGFDYDGGDEDDNGNPYGKPPQGGDDDGYQAPGDWVAFDEEEEPNSDEEGLNPYSSFVANIEGGGYDETGKLSLAFMIMDLFSSCSGF